MISQFLHFFLNLLDGLAETVPLPLFTFLGSFVEEIIAPIPSPLVMMLAGSLAGSQSQPWHYLFLLAGVGAVGKTIASYIMYLIADKSEDLILTKFGKFIGVTHKHVESIGRHLNKGITDDIVVFLLRAIPIMPTAPVSIICGIIKLNVRTYITSTFGGTLVRNIFYLFLGFTSIEAVEGIMLKLDRFETLGYLLLLMLISLPVGYVFFQRHKEVLIDKLLSVHKGGSCKKFNK